MAVRATTPPAKRTTRRRDFWASAIPEVPELDRLAQTGNPKAFAFPRHRPDRESLDLSFSGLKTSVRYFLESDAGRDATREDVAASFQAAVVDVLMARVESAFERGSYRAVVLSGGVAANSGLQARASRVERETRRPRRSFRRRNIAPITRR